MNLIDLIGDWQRMVFFFFCAVAGIQILYHLVLFSRFSIHRSKKNTHPDPQPVSVIICARDEARNLVRHLPGVLLQDFKAPTEVIVVNDNSVDESKYVLAELQNDWKQLNVIELTQEAKMIPGKKFPLSMGIKSARHEIILLTDADCIPATEHWISSMEEKYDEQTEIVLGYGAYRKEKGMLNKMVRWETFLSALQYFSMTLAGLPYMGVGRNLSYKKSLFFRQKGFSSHHHIIGGDDDLFINKAANDKNTAINTDKESFTLSVPPHSFIEWYRQKIRHYSTSREYKAIHKLILGGYSISQFLFYPLLVFAFCYDWRIAALAWGARVLIQATVYYTSMKKLDEKDLFPLFPLLDLGMFIYYLMFLPALFRKNKASWK